MLCTRTRASTGWHDVTFLCSRRATPNVRSSKRALTSPADHVTRGVSIIGAAAAPIGTAGTRDRTQRQFGLPSAGGVRLHLSTYVRRGNKGSAERQRPPALRAASRSFFAASFSRVSALRRDRFSSSRLEPDNAVDRDSRTTSRY